jgi:hypothetical protein
VKVRERLYVRSNFCIATITNQQRSFKVRHQHSMIRLGYTGLGYSIRTLKVKNAENSDLPTEMVRKRRYQKTCTNYCWPFNVHPVWIKWVMIPRAHDGKSICSNTTATKNRAAVRKEQTVGMANTRQNGFEAKWWKTWNLADLPAHYASQRNLPTTNLKRYEHLTFQAACRLVYVHTAKKRPLQSAYPPWEDTNKMPEVHSKYVN